MEFHLACKEGDTRKIKIFLDDPDFDPNQVLTGCGDLSGLPGLLISILANQVSVVKLLLADPRVIVNQGPYSPNNMIPLYVALRKQHHMIAKLLLDRPDVDPNVGSPSVLRMTIAARNHVGINVLFECPRLHIERSDLIALFDLMEPSEEFYRTIFSQLLHRSRVMSWEQHNELLHR